MDEQFLGGVVEGFYGQPWTMFQRFVLFEQMAEWGLNTYFYSPKDDLKHRAIWRELYDFHELNQMASLVEACQKSGLRFVYGLSPGLDIRFADPDEVKQIIGRFEQMVQIGVRDFALLFDDLQGDMREEDRREFPSFALAQSHVTNQVSDWLRGRFASSRLLFCPTPYCDRMVRWRLGGTDYLPTIGASLHRSVDFLWTGPEIISAEITPSSIVSLTETIQRKPVIWDNLHANDYDMRRIYCGPYSGRPPELVGLVRGILSNPNNEFWLNFIPLKTLGQFLKSPTQYDSDDAFHEAILRWAEYYEVVGERFSGEDVRLLAECYYLPFSLGKRGRELSKLVADLVHNPVDSWERPLADFVTFHQQIERILDGLTRLKNRELFYAWCRRVWELKEEVDLLRDYLEAKRNGKLHPPGFLSESHLPHTYRGGIVAELQRQLRLDASGRIRGAS